MSVRVRFAPSNTGYLHMGGARTALFNYLYAKKHGGTFVLRIEDTDLERSKDEYIDFILEAMDWLGMKADEGPYFQTKRMDLYKEKVQQLLDSGHAYKCFSSPEELEADREKALKEGRKPMYSRKWRDRTDHPDGEPYVVRFKTPLQGGFTIEDLVQGEVTVQAEELDDFVILRSDGSPTYNFVVVVDDATMGITHVVRGKDHLNNTFRQLPVFQALGYDLPRFAHLPLISGLSKRKGSKSVQAYRDKGYLQEAVLNYISRLGWSHGDQEIFTIDELIEYFDFSQVGRSEGQFDDAKFLWVNSEWMKRLPVADLAARWKPFLIDAGVELTDDTQVMAITELMRERAKTLVEMTEQTQFFFSDDFAFDEKAVNKVMPKADPTVFTALIDVLEDLAQWDKETLHTTFKEFCSQHSIGLGKVAPATRVAVTGGTDSPGLYDTLAIIGQERTVARMKKGLQLIQ